MLKHTRIQDRVNPRFLHNGRKTLLISTTCLVLAACGGSSGGGASADTQGPAITVDDQLLLADSENNLIDLALSDNRDNASELSVSLTSSNQKVLSDNGMTLTIDGNDASISLTPNFDEVGNTMVTISATDRSDNQSQALFQVQVVGNETTDTVVINELLSTGEDQDPILINGFEFIEEIEAEDAFDHLFDS